MFINMHDKTSENNKLIVPWNANTDVRISLVPI